MVAKQNLTVYAGADYRQAIELKNESEVLMDLTGYTFRGQARVAYADNSPTLSFDFTIRDQVSDTGIVDMHIPAADTTALDLSKATIYIYDIEMVDPDGDVKRIVEGQIKIHPEVTK